MGRNIKMHIREINSGTDLTGLWQVTVMDSFEYGNKPLGSIKIWKFIN
jgi:hypothetical protein